MASTKQSARIGDAAVKAKTGKVWNEWFKVLDAAGGKTMTHQQRVAFVNKKHGVGPWWQQMVAVTYEQARGLRQVNEKPQGYEISVSRTIDASVAKTFKAWEDKRIRSRWLKEPITIRKATTNKSLRITWSDGKTSVQVNLYEKGVGKCQIVAQHSKLANQKSATKMKKVWSDALKLLRKTIE